jgi:hypothetical protein
MALVECGLCGWSQTVDEELPPHIIEWKATEAYAQHMLEDHSDIARADPNVQFYVRTVASIVAPTNGAVVKKKHD